jgi:hypothetical protein
MKAGLEVADIVRQYGRAYRDKYLASLSQLKVMSAIESCRTARLGGHVDGCTNCGHLRISYNSCRNRHCPKCQCLAKEQWLEARRTELLPVPYFHVVFTLPDLLNELVMSNEGRLYNLLFKAAWGTIEELCKSPNHLGAQPGMIGVLHTWGQNLSLHPHIHCIVPGGGLSKAGKWVPSRSGFFIHVKVLSGKFQGKFLDLLKKAYQQKQVSFHGKAEKYSKPGAFKLLLDQLYKKAWVVYAKTPMGGPMRVINYLSRYTHRIAISNHRLMKVENERVYFRWKDYRDGNKQKETCPPNRLTSLPVFEFIRRFLLHVLPKGFHKIRYFGILAIRNRKTKLALCQNLLGYKPRPCVKLSWQQRLKQLTGIDPSLCPQCGLSAMQLKGHLPAIRPPPLSNVPSNNIITIRPKVIQF